MNGIDAEQTDNVTARIIASWAGSKSPVEPKSIEELEEGLGSLSDENAAAALVNTIHRIRKAGKQLPTGIGDLAFRLRNSIAEIYDVDHRRSAMDACNAAVAKLEAAMFEFESAVSRFLRTSTATAKVGSIEVLRLSHGLCPFLVLAERGFLRELEVLIGPAFRKFCEAYERNEDLEVLRRGPEFLRNVQSHIAGPNDSRSRSALWSENAV